MQFHAALSTADDLGVAIDDVVTELRRGLGDQPVDLCLVFASPALGELERLPATLRERTGARVLVGCSAGGLVGAGREIEGAPALAVLAGRLPGARLLPRHLTDDDLPDSDDPPSAWVECLGLDPKDARGFVVLADPFSLPAERLLVGLDYAWPGVPKVGGLASGGAGAAGQVVFEGDLAHPFGAVVLGLGGDVTVQALVAQGCRPIGAVGRITQCEDNYLIAVDGKPALEFLRVQLDTLGADERDLARRSPVFLGVAMDPFRLEAPGPGDFLVRNIMGYDPSTGMMAIGEQLGVGRAVQFHLRDAETSAQDLADTLRRATRTPAPRGALMFACLGRGANLYGRSGFDSEAFQARFGDVPLGGFFCNGEIGPVGSTTYLHGYTSSFALLRERSD